MELLTVRTLANSSDEVLAGEALQCLASSSRVDRLDSIQQALKSSDLDDRKFGVQLLAYLDEADRLRVIDQCLKDSSPEIRRACISYILSSDQNFIKNTSDKLLNDPDPVTKQAAISLLQKLPYQLAWPRLKELLNAPDPEARRCALEALTKFRGPDAIPFIKEALDHPRNEVALTAASLLPSIPHDNSSLLEHGMTHKDENVRLRSAEMLASGAISAEIKLHLLKMAFDSDLESIRRIAISLLNTLSDLAFTQIVEHIWQSPYSDVQEVLTENTARLSPDKVSALCKKHLHKASPPNIRRNLLRSLTSLNADERFSLIQPELNDPDSSIQVEAILALTGLPDSKVFSIIREKMADPDLVIAKAAVSVGLSLPEKLAYVVFVKALGDAAVLELLLLHPERQLHEHAVRALINCGGSKLINLAAKGLEDNAAIVRFAAARTINAIVDARISYPLYKAALTDSFPLTREAAVYALTYLPVERAKALYSNGLRDPDPQIRKSVCISLSKRSKEEKETLLKYLLT